MRGTLWQRVREQTVVALESGALDPIRTELETCRDGGVDFQLRVVSSLSAKERARSTTKNPFEPPYEPGLFIAELPPAHVALLNKFPVLEHHLLVVTRAYEPQQSLLTPADCEVLLTCLGEGDALAFYNGGPTAGASQSHKHLQLVPLTNVPMEPLLRARTLPFPHALSDTPMDAGALHACYLGLLHQVLTRPDAPYNLLATREWTLVVPRTAESFEGVSVNALGFAGSLFMKTRAQLERLREIGPMRALLAVTTAP